MQPTDLIIATVVEVDVPMPPTYRDYNTQDSQVAELGSELNALPLHPAS